MVFECLVGISEILSLKLLAGLQLAAVIHLSINMIPHLIRKGGNGWKLKTLK